MLGFTKYKSIIGRLTSIIVAIWLENSWVCFTVILVSGVQHSDSPSRYIVHTSHRCSYQPSRYHTITVSVTVFPVFLFIHSVTGSLDLPLHFTHFVHLPLPPLYQPSVLLFTGLILLLYSLFFDSTYKWYVTCFWLNSLNPVASRFIHSGCRWQDLFLFYSCVILPCGYIYMEHIIICSSVDGHLDYFHILGIVNNVVNVGVHISFLISGFFFSLFCFLWINTQ